MTNSATETTPARDSRAEKAFARRDLRAQLQELGPHRLLVGLDALALALVVAAYAQLGPPELLFHGVFVVLTIDAFLYGRRVTFLRIGASSIALLGYVALPSFESGVDALDLTEWPLMFTIAILVAWMADRERTAVRRYAGLYRAARDRLVTAQEEERRRLSRNLHDGIGQTLTALTMSLDAATAGRPHEASPHLDRARDLAVVALAEARSVAERIRPPRLEARGLASALHELALGCGLPVAINLDPAAAAELPPAHVIEVFRIAQEAIGNAVRHARASAIAVELDRVHGALRLRIADDGIGFDADRAGGLGLTGMRERTALMGARLRIGPGRSGGTVVTLVAPLPRVADGVAGTVPEPAGPTGSPGA